MRNHYIYLVLDTWTNKFYCGKRSTCKNPKDDFYFGSGIIISRILKKYTKEQIKKRLLKVVLQITSSALENSIAERYWVNDVYKAYSNPLFYNIAKIDSASWMGHTEEKKQKIRANISKSLKGKIQHTPEFKLKVKLMMSDRNSPSAKNIIVVDKYENIIFTGIRKEVIAWCESNYICCEATMKKYLYSGKPFSPQKNMKKRFNSFLFVGIRFLYV